MALGTVAYNAIFKKTSSFLVLAVAAAFFVERGVDLTTDAIFDNHNRGKQWKDIKHQYEK